VAASLSNVAGAFFRAMPSAGGFSQTAMNQSSGSQTQVSEVVTTALAVACAVWLGSVLSDLPEATLGCLVIIAVIGLIDPREMTRFWRLSRVEFWVAASTAAVGLTVGLLAAVLVGVVVTLLMVLHELNQVSVTELQPNDDQSDLLVADDPSTRVPGLLVLRFDGPLYTANIRSANRRVLGAVDDASLHGVLVLDLSAIAMVTLTVADQVTDLEDGLTERGVTLWIAALTPKVQAVAEHMPSWGRYLDPPRVYPTALAAVHAFAESR
jgi:sulfate permease, SulP family